MITIQETTEKISDRKAFSSWFSGTPPDGWLSGPTEKASAGFYRENGFLVLDRILSPEEIDLITGEAARICRNAEDKVEGIPPAPLHVTDDEVMQKTLCIHFPHKLSTPLQDVLSHPSIVEILTTIIGPNVKCMQSMLFFKAAGKPGQAWHQDEDYIPTRDRSLTGVWIALDDATVENGCLWIIPGSQKPGILWKQEWHGDRSFDCALEARGFPYTVEDEVPVEVKKGSVVFFNGYTLHRSLPNRTTSGYRRALVNHYMSAESFLPWRFTENTSMAMQDYRDIVMVAGVDPYEWKGIDDQLAKPSVRAAGDGGCINWVTKEPMAFKD